MQKQQDAGCVRGTGDVSLLYGLNVALAVLMDPLLLPVFMFCARQGPIVVCVCAIVRFIVSSHGIRGRFHLSALIIGGSHLVNCLKPGYHPL